MDAFIVDAFIGNWDRHNGNWGFLYDQEKDLISMAPIFDCGSSLYPQVDEKLMVNILSSKNEMNARVYEMPTSAIQINGERANYQKVISSHEFSELDEALKHIAPGIDLIKISELINSVESLSALHKTFIIKMLALRKNILLDEPLKNILRMQYNEPNFVLKH